MLQCDDGAWLQDVRMQSQLTPSTTFSSPLHYGLVGTDAPKAECVVGEGDEEEGEGPLDDHDVCVWRPWWWW